MGSVIEYVLGQGAFDLVLGVFAESHYAGHQFFHHMERGHWAHEADVPPDLRRAFVEIVKRVDTRLGRLQAILPEGATLLVVSVHGFEPNVSGNPMLAEVLMRLGYQAAAPAAAPSGVARVLAWTAGVRELIPRRVRDYINRHLVPDSVHDEVDANAFSGGIDWARTRAFMLPSDHFHGLISLNLRGREPAGTVAPGEEADALCDEIARELRRLVHADTGRRAVADVIRTADVHPGPNVHLLPDLVVRWSTESPLKVLAHPSTGRVASPVEYPLRKTQHTEHGFLLAAGPSIRAQAVAEAADVRDIAPTVLHLLGQPVPDELEGRVLEELLDPAWRARGGRGEHSLARSASADS
jgi:predicted AlkP superfamily phosphohydrolase/phosphomutase